MKSNDKFLSWGYKAAILLSFVGMIGSALYLFVFQLNEADPTSYDNEIPLIGLTAAMQMRLLSTAIFVGMSFGFLGFALFLIQAKGSVDIDASSENHKIKITQLSPGLFVILCATVIIIMASTYKIGFTLESVPQEVPIDQSEVQSEPDTVRTDPLDHDLLGIPNSNEWRYWSSSYCP